MQFRILNKSNKPSENKIEGEQVQKLSDNPQTVREVLKGEVTKDAAPNNVEIKNTGIDNSNGNGKEEKTVGVSFKQEMFNKQEVLRLLKANNDMEVRNRVKIVRDALDAILETGGNEIPK